MVRFMSSENNNAWQLSEPETNLFTEDDIWMYLNLTSDDEPITKRFKSSTSSQTDTELSSENNNVCQLPESETKLLVEDDISMYRNMTGDEPLTKHTKQSDSSSSQTTTQQLIFNNELSDSPFTYDRLNEPSPLGLRLKKSPSLLALAQKTLDQCNSEKSDLPSENLEAETKSDSKARTMGRSTRTNNKLKASHFQALLLRIGKWEYVSKHEGDLVAKCYFSKHKIVWELLDGGLKKKFEINWADIVGLKANCAAYEPGTLTIVLDKQPAFYHEINPQPKKHTQWRVTSDFTGGEASTNRKHVIQCAQGVLDKHFKKLIQCDARLNFMSQQQDVVSNVPYFSPKPFFDDQDMSGNGGFNLQDIHNIEQMASTSTLLTSSSKTVESSSLFFIQPEMSKDVYSSSSGMSTDIEWQKDITPRFQSGISMLDVTNYTGNSCPEQYVSPNLPFVSNAVGQDNPDVMLENISQILLSDNQLTPTSDERAIMSKVNSFYNLLQFNQDGQNIENESFTPDRAITMLQDRPGGFTLDSFQISKSTTKEDDSMYQSTKIFQDYPNERSTYGFSEMAQQNENLNVNLESNATPEHDGISRNDSFADLVNALPSIASLPRFLFDLSENGEILK